MMITEKLVKVTKYKEFTECIKEDCPAYSVEYKFVSYGPTHYVAIANCKFCDG